MEFNETVNHPFMKKIERINQSRNDPNFMPLVAYHLKTIDKYVQDDGIESVVFEDKMELCRVLLSKFFLDNVDTLPDKGGQCSIDERSDLWPVPMVPLEEFCKELLPADIRKANFYSYLKVGDIMDCIVQSVQSTQVHLQVLHKYKSSRILKDLKLMVYMNLQIDREKPEQLRSNDYVRVAVAKITPLDANGYDVCVTMDETRIHDERKENLGKISYEQLPLYLRTPLSEYQKHSTYVDYLISHPQFKFNCQKNFSKLFKAHGLDPDITYSYYEELNKKKPKENAESLMKLSGLVFVRKLLNEKSDIPQTPENIATALDMCPNDDSTYYLKSALHFLKAEFCNIRHPTNVKLKFQDYILSYILDPTASEAGPKIAETCYKVAYHNYKCKEYKLASQIADTALYFNKDHAQARALMTYLKKREEKIANMNLVEEGEIVEGEIQEVKIRQVPIEVIDITMDLDNQDEDELIRRKKELETELGIKKSHPKRS